MPFCYDSLQCCTDDCIQELSIQSDLGEWEELYDGITQSSVRTCALSQNESTASEGDSHKIPLARSAALVGCEHMSGFG